MIRTLLKPLSFIPAILLMYVIFRFSAQTGDVSSQVSYQVSYQIVYAVDDVVNAGMEGWEIDTWVYRIHWLVRKAAHVTLYFALAIAVAFPLYVYGVRGIWLMLLAGFICVAFACSDEYHQSFVEGRGPSSRDVMIDSIGIFFGIILVRIVGWTGRMTIFRPTQKQLAKKEQKEQLKAAKKAAKKARKQAAKGQDILVDNNAYSDFYGNPYSDQPRRIRHDAEFNRLDEMLFENQELPDPADWDISDHPTQPHTQEKQNSPYASVVSQDTKIYERPMTKR